MILEELELMRMAEEYKPLSLFERIKRFLTRIR